MRFRISPHQAREKIRHLVRQIPTRERTAVNERELLRQPKLLPPPRTLTFVKPKPIEVHATRNNYVVWRPAAQSFPNASSRYRDHNLQRGALTALTDDLDSSAQGLDTVSQPDQA